MKLEFTKLQFCNMLFTLNKCTVNVSFESPKNNGIPCGQRTKTPRLTVVLICMTLPL